jgi:hypothetical protein
MDELEFCDISNMDDTRRGLNNRNGGNDMR